MRRWLSFVLSMSLIASLVLSNSAVAFEASIIRKPIKTIDASHVSTRLGADINSITYSNLRVNIENGRDSNCRMTFTLHVGPDSYEINVAGQLEERVLSESNSIFHGCLRGTVEIKGTKYNVTASLSKQSIKLDGEIPDELILEIFAILLKQENLMNMNMMVKNMYVL